MDETKIIEQLKPIKEQDIIEDFRVLRDIGKHKITVQHLNSKLGSDIVDYFTFAERLHTTGNHGIDFFDFLKQLPELKKKDYVKNMVRFYKTDPEKKNTPPMKMWYRIFSLYFGSINIFKPLVAMNIYKMFGAKSVLDPTMGWGGRFIGAAALDITHYIGIDMNVALREPYQKMKRFLSQTSSTKATLLFKNALKVNYSLYKYDMVFTSPPYYNIEKYNNTKTWETKEEWNTEFYIPLFTKTMAGLDVGGWYCINIPIEIYDNVCYHLWGKANKKIPLNISSRLKDGTYKEYIYCWNKQ
jgi:hypothetical protein